MKLQNWVLELWSNYETATASIFHLHLPAPRPPATPYAGAGHVDGQVPSPRPKPPRAPLVFPKPPPLGTIWARHAHPPSVRSPRRWPAELPGPCAPPPGDPSPANSLPARPPPHPWPIKGQHDPSHAPRELEPPPPWPASAGAPWSRRSAPSRLQ